MKRSIAAASLIALCATAAVAGKPTPTPPSPFVPSFAYYVSGNTYELRLSNEAGTAAVLVQRSSKPLGVFKFGPANQRTLYYVDQATSPNQMKKVSWSYDSAGAFVLATPTTVLAAEAADFAISPDGSKLAYQRPAAPFGNYSPFDLVVRDLTSGAEILVTTSLYSPDLDWSHDGSWIYLRQADRDFPDEQGQPSKILRVAPQANASPEKLVTGEVIFTGGASKLPAGSTEPLEFMLSIMREEWGYNTRLQRLGLWDGVTTTAEGKPQLDFSFPLGAWPSFACGNRKFVYTSYDSRNRPTINIYNRDTQQIVQFSRDTSFRSIEWIGC